MEAAGLKSTRSQRKSLDRPYQIEQGLMIECVEARLLGRVGNLELDAIKFDSYRT
jgi:hypothetical protein